MGGFFGAVSSTDCVNDIFFGTDYHSHLGNLRGGIMTFGAYGMRRFIHDITNTPFRAKFEGDLEALRGATSGIGCISDTGDQPVMVRSHLGTFGAVMVGAINNLNALVDEACTRQNAHFSELGNDGVNPNEVAATIVATGSNIEDGIRSLQEAVDGSCSMLMLSGKGIYAIRDAMGRTPVFVGCKSSARAVSMEPCAMLNLGYNVEYELGPGEAVLVTVEGIIKILPPRDQMQICSFFWVYFGFPAATYEGQNVECVRYRCGNTLAAVERQETGLPLDADSVVGIPDSGVAHALGYAEESQIPYRRAFIKYTPTWARSFIPSDQLKRAHVATMKLLPVKELIDGKKLVFCEDSIVRGTQLGNTFQRLAKLGAAEVNVRSACPPILFNCRYLNFSKSNGLKGLAGVRAIAKVEDYVLTGDDEKDKAWFATVDIRPYLDTKSTKYARMVETIREELGFTTLRYQGLDDLIKAIGLPREKLCTYCWDGHDCTACKHCK